MKFTTFEEFKKSIVHLQYKVILPDGITLDKGRWTSHKGFNVKGFNLYLEELYNHKYKEDAEQV